MSGESESTTRARSKTPKEQLFAKSRRLAASTPISKFGTIVRALWPDKPALNLAQRVGTSERGAQLVINGERKPSARHVAVIVNEMLD